MPIGASKQTGGGARRILAAPLSSPGSSPGKKPGKGGKQRCQNLLRGCSERRISERGRTHPTQGEADIRCPPATPEEARRRGPRERHAVPRADFRAIPAATAKPHKRLHWFGKAHSRERREKKSGLSLCCGRGREGKGTSGDFVLVEPFLQGPPPPFGAKPNPDWSRPNRRAATNAPAPAAGLPWLRSVAPHLFALLCEAPTAITC